jgi:hypothetical protein
MRSTARLAVTSICGVLVILFLTACGGGSKAASPSSSTSTAKVAPGAVDPNAIETPVPGDIPDNQMFVAFNGPGFAIKVPEGWARTANAETVSFSDHYNSIQVETAPSPSAPSAASTNATEVAQVRLASLGFKLGKVTTVNRSAGPAVLMTYQALSAPNPVTGKRVVLDVERYEFWRNGTQATITLSGSKGSDNVDPWKTVTDSFAWAA